MFFLGDSMLIRGGGGSYGYAKGVNLKFNPRDQAQTLKDKLNDMWRTQSFHVVISSDIKEYR